MECQNVVTKAQKKMSALLELELQIQFMAKEEMYGPHFSYIRYTGYYATVLVYICYIRTGI